MNAMGCERRFIAYDNEDAGFRSFAIGEDACAFGHWKRMQKWRPPPQNHAALAVTRLRPLFFDA